jgi:hypothetical protein
MIILFQCTMHSALEEVGKNTERMSCNMYNKHRTNDESDETVLFTTKLSFVCIISVLPVRVQRFVTMIL